MEVPQSNRSWLYVPGDRHDRFGKAIASGADAVIFDLEDSVLPSQREIAIRRVDDFLGTYVGDVRLWVRVNDAINRHPDVVALARHGSLDGFVIPKFEAPEHCAGWGKPTLGLIETPKGVVECAKITAAAAVHLHGIALGPEDLSVNLGVAPTLDSLNHAAASIVMAGHAAKRYAYACPGSIGEFRDLNAWRLTLEAGRRLGGHGSMCIHPAQVAVANEVFTPSGIEVDWATRVLAVWESGGGQGALEMDGKMIDLPVVQRARNVLARTPGNIARPARQRQS